MNVKVKSLSKNSRCYVNHSYHFKWLKNTNWLIEQHSKFSKKLKLMNLLINLFGISIAYLKVAHISKVAFHPQLTMIDFIVDCG